MKKEKDNTLKLMFWICAILFGGMYLTPMMVEGSGSYFDKWVAPGQTTSGRINRIVYVSSDPVHPTTITALNNNRVDLWIINESSYSTVRIVLATAATPVIWSTTTARELHFKLESLAFSSNSFPTTIDSVWVLQEYSTKTFVGWTEINGGSITVANPNYNQFKRAGVNGNSYHEKEAGHQTYVGTWYAVAVGTMGPAAPGAPGKVRVIEEQP